MAGKKTLYIQIGADVKGAVKGINTVSKQLSAFGAQARSVRNIAIAVTGVVAIKKLVGGLHDLARSSQDEVAGQARLQRAIANTGKAVDTQLIGSLESWVETQERATGFADDEVRAALSILVAETGSLTEAQKRYVHAADLARGMDVDLVSASRMLGKVTDENTTALKRLGIQLPDVGAGYSEAAAQADMAAELQHKAGISFEGAMKLVKSGGAAGESVLKRYGVAMRKAAKGADVSAEQVLGAVDKAVGGQARDRMAALGPGAQLANDWQNLREEVGSFFVPIFAKGAAFALKGIRGLRRVMGLFTTDLSGPKIGSARKIWKAVFGVEMPEALGVVVDSFGKIAERIKTFVDDLNSTDDDAVRGAVKKLFASLKDDVAAGMKSLGEELDKQGAVGLGLKILIGSMTFGIANAATIGVAGALFDILKSALQIAWLSVALLGSGPVLAIAAGVLLGISFVTVVDHVVEAWRTAEGIYDVVKKALLFGGIALAAFGAVAGFPIAAAVSIAVVLGIGAVMVADAVGGSDWGGKFLDQIIKNLPFGVSHVAGALKMVIPIVVEWAIGGPPNPPKTPVVVPFPPKVGDVVPTVKPAASPGAFLGKTIGGLEGWFDERSFRLADGIAIPMHQGGDVPRDMLAWLQGGEHVLSRDQVARGGGGGGGVMVNVYGDVDSEARVSELGREFSRQVRLLGLAT